MATAARIAIVGDGEDLHVEAVVNLISQPDLLVFDATTFANAEYILQSGSLEIARRSSEAPLVLTVSKPARGWIRRLAAPDWQRGVVVESREAAIKSAWLSLLSSSLRTCGVEWLTDIDTLMVAENKLIQKVEAERIGIKTPTTIVTNSANAAREILGHKIVLKPLGPGHFFVDDEPYVVYATAVEAGGKEMESLKTAPFLAQERLDAISHLRVVTVQGEAWSGILSASSWPMDWRSASAAHVSFNDNDQHADVLELAINMARCMRLGYSSQDWIITDNGPYLLDVNPAGQWLFLSDKVGHSVAAAIANWLQGR